MNIIEDLRKVVIDDIMALSSFQSVWSTWQGIIRPVMGSVPTAPSIIEIGNHLSDVFFSTNTGGRGQSDVSVGGTVWECLVTWYLNLCMAGTRAVAIKKMSQVPTPIKDAITVSYSNFICSTESDITVVVFADDPCFTQNNPALYTKRGKIDKSALDALVTTHFRHFSVGVVQCKTNWNDNAQIPMLWDMVYSAGGFPGRNISVGVNNFYIPTLRGFTYSFVTVPTNDLSEYNPASVPVSRVKNLSGGNYWGFPTRNAVAKNVKEIFRNYQSGFTNNDIYQSLSAVAGLLSTTYSYFNI